jgi:hypothetical protein
VYAILSQFVQDEWQKVRTVKEMQNSIAGMAPGVTKGTVDAVRDIVGSIPAPPLLDLSFAMSLLTCPLTPDAIGVLMYQRTRLNQDVSRWTRYLGSLDPRQTVALVREMHEALLKRVEFDYRVRLRGIPQWVLILSLYQYIEEVGKIGMTAESLAIAQALTLKFKAVYPSEYPGSIFEAFDNEVTDWTFSGMAPPGLSGFLQEITELLAEAQTKLLAWKQVVFLG